MCIANLRGDLPEGAIGYMSRAEALRQLRAMSGLDYGDDVKKWEVWLQQQNAAEAEPDSRTRQDILKELRERRSKVGHG
jgi:hypothetical protein